MADACPMPGCTGTLSAPRVTCVETTVRTCAKCTSACLRQDDCAHEAELARLRGVLGTVARSKHDAQWNSRALALVCLPDCRACLARAALDNAAPPRAERT